MFLFFYIKKYYIKIEKFNIMNPKNIILPVILMTDCRLGLDQTINFKMWYKIFYSLLVHP